MKLQFTYWIYLGGGGHTILSLLPAVLDCENCSFGQSIETIKCLVFFRATNQPGPDYRTTYDQFHSELSELPTFRLHKNQRFLKLKYITSSRKMICSVAWEKITYNVFGLGEVAEPNLNRITKL